MEYYKPSQNLSYFFVNATQTLFLKSYMNAYLPSLESLANQDTQYGKPATYTLKYMGLKDVSASVDYLYEHAVLMKLMDHVNLNYDANDPQGFNKKMLDIIAADLQKNGTAAYIVTTIVYKIDGTVGGQVTNTIAASGQVEVG